MAKTVDRKAYEQKLRRAHAAKKANSRRTVKAPTKKTRAKVKAVAKSFKRKKPAPKARRKNPTQKKHTLQEILTAELNVTLAFLEKQPKSFTFARQAHLSHGQGMVDFAVAIDAISSQEATKYRDALKKAAGL